MKLTPDSTTFTEWFYQLAKKAEEPVGANPQSQLRQREIRDRLVSLKECDRIEKYLSANQSEDMETINAVESAPKAFPLVPEKIITEQKKRRLERKFPDWIQGLESKFPEECQILKNYYNAVSLRKVMFSSAKERLLKG